MNKRRKILALMIISSIPLSSVHAGIRIDFDRNNNTYNWLTSLDHTISHKRHNFRAYVDGHSNLIKGGFDRWQENATAGFDSELSIRDRLALVLNGEYTVNGLDRRRVRTTELAMGLSVQPVDFARFTPVIRAANKQRSELEIQHDERGLGYGIRGDLMPLEFRGISMIGNASYDRINLSNIPWQEGQGFLNISTRYWRADTISISMSGAEATKKYYSSGGKVEEITRQIKQQREAVLAVNILLPAQFRLRIDGGFHLSRYLYRQNQADDSYRTQRDNYGRGGDYAVTFYGNLSDVARVSVGYTWDVKGEDFQGLELDQDTDKGELSVHGSFRLSSRDSLAADLLFGVTSYSNPNIGSDMDDRDQKTILINGAFNHHFSRYFSAGVKGGANSFHQIYISGARSANNSRNDTYIMAPYAIWEPVPNLLLKQSFDIQANYITFDFDRKKIATKNRIFRRATSRTELTVNISDRLKLVQGYLYRYEDYGLLIWDDGWQQAVSWDRKRSGLDTRFLYTPIKKMRITPFFSWEKTGDFHRKLDPSSDAQDPVEIRYLKDEQVKMYFEVEIAFFWNQRRSLVADFSHRLRKFMDRPRETNDYVRISMEYLF
jgi:hypothetical protein